MKITFHGAGQEVGRSCIEVVTDKKRVLLDAGLKITRDGNLFPTTIEHPESIQHVFVSHIHLDHTGALPLLYAQGLRSAIYMTSLTKDLLKILLKDSWKIAMIEKQQIGYRKSDIGKMLELAIPFDETDGKSSFSLPELLVSTCNAGHVPGSRSILLDLHGTTLLYTGDTSSADNSLIKGLDVTEYPQDIDVLITESTYGGTDHPPRESVAKEFLDHVKTALDRGGHVVIPTFSIGRAQELIMLLHEAKFSVPIYFDGMAKVIAEIFLAHPEYLQNSQKLANTFHSVRLIEKAKDREAALAEQSIIVTTAGMLDGGPICYYIPKIAKSKKTALLLTGYQAENSNGRRLLDAGYVEIDNKKYTIACDVKKYDFSAHAGMSELHEIIRHVRPKHVIIQHGEGEQLRALKDFIESETSAMCHMPKTGDTIHITKAP